MIRILKLPVEGLVFLALCCGIVGFRVWERLRYGKQTYTPEIPDPPNTTWFDRGVFGYN